MDTNRTHPISPLTLARMARAQHAGLPASCSRHGEPLENGSCWECEVEAEIAAADRAER